MAEVLWTAEELAGATGVLPSEPLARSITGVSIDSRTLQPGDLFVAIRGDSQNGHAYVDKALADGAATAIVEAGYEGRRGPLVRVADPLEAMRALGRAARARSGAKIIAVTGSVGKTGTKEMLRLCLSACGPTHASEKSYNNHWGVPLTLARMPRSAQFGVFEIGMNHAGEITPLTKIVRPHIAIITTVGPVHIEYFSSEEAIADAKAEIFDGIEPGGIAILNRDNRHFDRLAAAARRAGVIQIADVGPFQHEPACYSRLRSSSPEDWGSDVSAAIGEERIDYKVAAPGDHYVWNSLAVLATVKLLGGELRKAAAALAGVAAPAGRGMRQTYTVGADRITLIDESYNANPLSVRAALAAMAKTPRAVGRRRIVVLGDMRELGEQSDQLHRELLQPVVDAGSDIVFACGPFMRELYELLPQPIRGQYRQHSSELVADVVAAVAPGDVVMIKGSLGTRMGPIVEALKARLSAIAA